MTSQPYDGPILEIERLSISFFTRLREIPAVMDFSCTIMPGEAMGLVGESGCGKSTVALGVMQDLGGNGRIVSGSIKFKGRELTEMSQHELRKIRGSEIAMIYQEPMASLNPAMKVGKQLIEVPMIHQGASRSNARELALQVVTDVKLPEPRETARWRNWRGTPRPPTPPHPRGSSAVCRVTSRRSCSSRWRRTLRGATAAQARWPRTSATHSPVSPSPPGATARRTCCTGWPSGTRGSPRPRSSCC